MRGGIAKGAQLSFPFVYVTGVASFDAQMREMAASWEQAGIKLQQEPKSFQEVLTDAFGPHCVPNKPCAWVVADWGGGWIYVPDYYPTGEALFLSGASLERGRLLEPHGRQPHQLDQHVVVDQRSVQLRELHGDEPAGPLSA